MESVIVDSEVATLRAELQLAVASRMVRGEESGLPAWVGRNPLELASSGQDKLPVANAGGPVLSKPWQWDAEAGALIYEYRNGERRQLRLAKIRPGQSEGWALGGGLILVSENMEKRR